MLGFECETRSLDSTAMLISNLGERVDYFDVLADLAFDLTGLLRRALDFMASLDAASSDSDLSYIHQPSITQHDQNTHTSGWTHLIELTRDAQGPSD